MMNGWLAVGAVVVFGLCYAAVIRQVRKRKLDHGLTPFMVAGGVTGVSVSFALVIGVELAALLLVMFVLAGLPMMWEYYDWRWQRERDESERVAIDL